MFLIGIVEPTQVKESAILFAVEAVAMILRIDQIIYSKDTKKLLESNIIDSKEISK